MSLSGYGRLSSRQFALQNLTYRGGSMPILQPPSLLDPLPPGRGGREVGRAGRDGRRGSRGGAGVGGGRGRPKGGGGRGDGRGEKVTGSRPLGRFLKPAGRQQLAVVGPLSLLLSIGRSALSLWYGGRVWRGERVEGGGHRRRVA
jgi:hypothetical protein